MTNGIAGFICDLPPLRQEHGHGGGDGAGQQHEIHVGDSPSAMCNGAREMAVGRDGVRQDGDRRQGCRSPTCVNDTLHSARGIYFEDPSGHLLELITTLYGDPPAGLGAA